jgi:hypothetical protein
MTPTEKAIREFCGHHADWWPSTTQVQEMLALAQPEQEPVAVDQEIMELAESVGLIGPASRTHDLHNAIQRFHDLICANATIKSAVAFSRTLEAKDGPVAKFHVEHRTNACSEVCDEKGKVYATCDWTTEASKRAQLICDLLNTTPPAAQPAPVQEPVQVSPLEFVTMVIEKEHLIGKPLFWAEWPNKEKNT